MKLKKLKQQAVELPHILMSEILSGRQVKVRAQWGVLLLNISKHVFIDFIFIYVLVLVCTFSVGLKTICVDPPPRSKAPNVSPHGLTRFPWNIKTSN